MPRPKPIDVETAEAPLQEFHYPQYGVIKARSQAEAEDMVQRLKADIASQ